MDLQNISTVLANYQIQPPNVNVLQTAPSTDAGVAAKMDVDYAHHANDLLTWYISNVADAVRIKGQDANQILLHELDHLYFERVVLPPNSSLPATATATINGVTYNFNLSLQPPLPNTTDTRQRINPGYVAFEHMWIHNDLVATKNVDKTGALQEALEGATNKPLDPEATAKSNAANSATFSIALAAVPRSQTCNTNSGVTTQSFTSADIQPSTFYSRY